MRRETVLLVTLLAGITGTLGAQATGTPSFNAPYRAFSRSEFGGTLSFPSGANFALEGQYRFGYQEFDVGVRGGLIDFGGGFTRGIVGVEGRGRVITHTEQFPLDGAVIVGLGGSFGSGNSNGLISGGLSLGRRVDPKGSQVSIVLYGEPTLYLRTSGGGNPDFALGLGADLRLSKVFDLRVSVGLGDNEGAAFSAVWVH